MVRPFLSLLLCSTVIAFSPATLASQAKEGSSISQSSVSSGNEEDYPATELGQTVNAPVDSAVSLEPVIPLDEANSGKIVSPTALPTSKSGVSFLSLNYHNVEDDDPDQT